MQCTTKDTRPVSIFLMAIALFGAALANPDDKQLKDGKAYNFAFAVHDDNITTRGHRVSFPLTVGFGAKADIDATRLK